LNLELELASSELEGTTLEYWKGLKKTRMVKGIEQHWHDPFGWHPISRKHRKELLDDAV